MIVERGEQYYLHWSKPMAHGIYAGVTAQERMSVAGSRAERAAALDALFREQVAPLLARDEAVI